MMRRLLILLVVFALLLGGLWLGGENLLASKIRQVAGQNPAVQLNAVRELRDPGRIGVRLSDLQVAAPQGAASLPSLELWVTLAHLTRGNVALPPQLQVTTQTGSITLETTDAVASLGLRPLSGLSVGKTVVQSGPLKLNGMALANGLRIDADLGRLGHASPQAAIAAYDISAQVDGLDPTLFVPTLPRQLGLMQFTANGRVWLNKRLQPANMQPGMRPSLVGLKLDTAQLSLGPVQARIMGMLQPDAQGMTSGSIAIYTGDGRHLLEIAAQAGLIPQQAVNLAVAMLDKISLLKPTHEGQDPMQAGFVFPDPAQGEIRLPLNFGDGKVSLGPIPLGPAPVFPR